MKKLSLPGAIMLLFALFACNRSKGLDNENVPALQDLKKISGKVILDWNEVAFHAMGGAAYQHSLFASRINAMMHLAMHDAINAVSPSFKTYALQARDARADAVVAAASAAHAVLLAAFPDKKMMLDSALTTSPGTGASTEAANRGSVIGKQAAHAILSLRQNDGASQDPIATIAPSAVPGTYQLVPPFNILYAPFWKNMQPFGLKEAKQFRVSPQPGLNTKAYAEGFNEVKEMGKKSSTKRTLEQTSYAMFWYEFSEIGWNRVARNVASDKKLDIVNTARIFALLNMALADAYTGGWDSKFHYNFWRPYTAIRNAATDSNESTHTDATWEPLMPTPPVQDYPSTHSALGNAAAVVLSSLLGEDVSFSMTSPTADPQNASRKFKNFRQAAEENADSRVMAGLHFRFSCDAGLELGKNIGDWILTHHLTPSK